MNSVGPLFSDVDLVRAQTRVIVAACVTTLAIVLLYARPWFADSYEQAQQRLHSAASHAAVLMSGTVLFCFYFRSCVVLFLRTLRCAFCSVHVLTRQQPVCWASSRYW